MQASGRRVAKVVRVVLLAGFMVGLPVVLVGAAAMSRVITPPPTRELDLQRIRQHAIDAVVGYITGHAEVKELRSTPFEVRPAQLRPLVARVLTEEVIRGQLLRLYATLSAYVQGSGAPQGRLVLSVGKERRLVVDALLRSWELKLNRLPACDKEALAAVLTNPRTLKRVSSNRHKLLRLLKCRPPGELKALLLERVGKHLRKMHGARESELVIFTGERHGGEADLAPWVARLQLVARVLGQGSLAALALVVLVLLAVVGLARVEGLEAPQVLAQLGWALVGAALLLVTAAVLIEWLSADTDYIRWLLHRPAAELTREEAAGLRLALYAFNRILECVVVPSLVMAGGVGLSGLCTLGAGRLVRRARARQTR